MPDGSEQPDRALRILQVVGAIGIRYGGPSQVASEMSRALAERGHHVDLVTSDADFGQRLDVPLRRFEPLGKARIAHYPCPWPQAPHPAPEVNWAVWRLLPNYDIAHFHGVFSAVTSLSTLAARWRGACYVVRPCGALNRYGMGQRRRIAKSLFMAAIERENLQHAAFIQASTPQEADEIGRLGVHSPIRVLPQGVEIPERPTGPRLEQSRYVLSVGRIAEKKNLSVAVRAVAQLPERHRDVKLVIAGGDEAGERDKLERLASDLGVSRRVRFVGTVVGEDKWTWYRDAVGFVLPSHDENFGVVVVEAVGAGVPVVVSPRVALCTQVAHFGAGLVSTAEANAFSLDLAEVLDRGRESYRSGCATMAERFSWGRCARDLESAYRDSLQRRRDG